MHVEYIYTRWHVLRFMSHPRFAFITCLLTLHNIYIYFPTTFITKTHHRWFWKVVRPAQAIASLHPTWLSPMMSDWLAKQLRTRRPPEEAESNDSIFGSYLYFEHVFSEEVFGCFWHQILKECLQADMAVPTITHLRSLQLFTSRYCNITIFYNSELRTPKIMKFKSNPSRIHKASTVWSVFPHFPLTEESLANDFTDLRDHPPCSMKQMRIYCGDTEFL